MESLNAEKLENVAFILKTIAHPTRLGIVNLLTENEKLSVNQICEALGIEQSLVSHHLNIMNLKGILNRDRAGKNIYYSLKLREVVKVIECMQNCERI